MAAPTFLVADTETGGLNAITNPVLSLGLLIADSNGEEIDGIELKLRPPFGTTLEVPVKEDQSRDGYGMRISGHYDVWTREMKSEPGPVQITAGAALINGFIERGPDGLWNLESCQPWLDTSFAPDDASHTILRMVDQYFPPEAKPAAVAYNAKFDAKMITQWLPSVARRLSPTWFCAMEAYKKRLNLKKGYKLVDACKTAGFDLGANAHEALADCRGALAVLRWLRTNQT